MSSHPQRPIPWDPRTYDCTHNRQRLLIEERIHNLEVLSKEVDEKNERIFKVLNDFEHFFTSFGQENPENVATRMIESVREKKSKEVILLGEKYFDLRIYILEYQELLQNIQNDGFHAKCWCSKKPIGCNN